MLTAAVCASRRATLMMALPSTCSVDTGGLPAPACATDVQDRGQIDRTREICNWLTRVQSSIYDP